MWERQISRSNSLSWSAVMVSVSRRHLRAKARRRALSVAEQVSGGKEWEEEEEEEEEEGEEVGEDGVGLGTSLEWCTTDWTTTTERERVKVKT